MMQRRNENLEPGDISQNTMHKTYSSSSVASLGSVHSNRHRCVRFPFLYDDRSNAAAFLGLLPNSTIKRISESECIL